MDFAYDLYLDKVCPKTWGLLFLQWQFSIYLAQPITYIQVLNCTWVPTRQLSFSRQLQHRGVYDNAYRSNRQNQLNVIQGKKVETPSRLSVLLFESSCQIWPSTFRPLTLQLPPNNAFVAYCYHKKQGLFFNQTPNGNWASKWVNKIDNLSAQREKLNFSLFHELRRESHRLNDIGSYLHGTIMESIMVSHDCTYRHF